MESFFPYRIARLSYFLRNVALAALGAVFAPLFDGESGGASSVAVLSVAALVLIYWGAFIVAPRCRDTGLSPWLGILVLVPVMNIFIGGYLTWKQSWPSMEGIDVHRTSVGSSSAPGMGISDRVEKSDALKRLEALRDDGVLTERDFLRRKARLGRNEKTG
jgi:hypothetical protein